MRQHTRFPITESIHALLREGLDELLEQPSDHKPPVAQFERLRLLLEALPLDTAEFGLAVNRLANARHYLVSGEFGAARYELRLLRRSLEQ
jgi:hypothetical protein